MRSRPTVEGSFTNRSQVFLAQAIGTGIGQGLLFLPSLIIIGHHFRRRRALATGIAVCVSFYSGPAEISKAATCAILQGASVGGITWPIMLNQLSQRTTFANAIRATAALAGILLLIANLIMKTRPYTRQNPGSAPLDAPNKPNINAILCDTAYMVSIAA